MSQHRKKITVRVTSQTAHHLRSLAEANNTTEGKIIDALVTASRPVKKSVETVDFHVKQQQIRRKS